MALVVGENTWATIADADEYLTTRFGSSAWFDLDDSPAIPGEESKESFLVMAFNILVNKGGLSLTADLTDTNVIYAQIEMALYLLTDYTLFVEKAQAQQSGLKSFDLSQWSEEYFESVSGDFSLPFMVMNFLSDYTKSNAFVSFEVE